MDIGPVDEVSRQKWRAKRREVEDDCEVVEEKLEIIVPKDKNNKQDWKVYYQERVKLLENPALHDISKLLCTNCAKKKELIQEYFDVLDALQLSVDAEDDLHFLEVEAKNIVENESRRLRSEQPQFFN